MADIPNNIALLTLLAMTLCGALLFGLVLVWAIAKRRQKNQQNQEASLPLPNEDASPPAPEPDVVDLSLLSNISGDDDSPSEPSFVPDSPPPEQSTPPEELLRLLRQPQTGQLMVEIAGQRYTKLADIADKKIGQFILKLTAHLLTFTNGVILTPTGLKSLGAPPPGDLPAPLIPVSRAAAPPVSPPTPRPLPPPPVQAPPRSRGVLGRNRPALEPTPVLNLADEINDIVQGKLLASPLADSNRIDITSDYSGGIRINVNGQFFASVNDVPDEEIRRLIQKSIKQWERS